MRDVVIRLTVVAYIVGHTLLVSFHWGTAMAVPYAVMGAASVTLFVSLGRVRDEPSNEM